MSDRVAVVPVKELAGAKQRLSPRFSAEQRRLVAATMVEDVLSALFCARGLAGILVVTADDEVATLARRFGAEVFAGEGARGGHTAAVTAGARHLIARGIGTLLTLPGDVPGVTAAEIERVLAAHGPAPAFTIVPAHDRRGSNAIVVSPPDLIGFSFGNDSFEPHLAAARAAGVAPRIVACEGIGLDIDNPEDLLALAAMAWPTRTNALLASGRLEMPSPVEGPTS